MSDNTSEAYTEIQTAIYTLLNGNITGDLYDEVGPGPTFPYTTFGEPSDLPFEARGVKGRAVLWPFHIYSKDQGGKFECFKIIGEIVELMTAGKLSMTGWKEVWKTFQPSRVERAKEEPGVTYKGFLTFLIVVNKQ